MLLIDANNIARKVFHSLPDKCTPRDYYPAVMFGFLSDVLGYGEQFRTNDIHFIWDGPRKLNRRYEVYPDYKIDRSNKYSKMSPSELELIKEKEKKLLAQIDFLKDVILPAMGFANVHYYPGYEGDDIIGSICLNRVLEKKVIISSDKDFYQLLTPDTVVFNPITHRIMTVNKLQSTLGVTPRQWIDVKAIGGCKSDSVPGCMPGVSEKSAIQFLTGNLPLHYVRHQKIISEEGKANIKRNLKLVRLPFQDSPLPEIKPNRFRKPPFVEVCNDYNLAGLLSESYMPRWTRFFMGKFEKEGETKKKRVVRKRSLRND